MSNTTCRAVVTAIAIAITLGLTTSASYAFNPQPDPPAKTAKMLAVSNPALLSGAAGASLPMHGHVGLGGGVSRGR